MAEDQTTTQDPTTQHPQPEQPELQLDHPGHEADMTPRVDHGLPEGQEDGDETVRLGRAVQPVQVAPAYVYFASHESSYVSGEVIGVTGGTPLH
jgi:NAD(P)-dependent dehydrogenase (short-subunit alcohol dehydrogenase family)